MISEQELDKLEILANSDNIRLDNIHNYDIVILKSAVSKLCSEIRLLKSSISQIFYD